METRTNKTEHTLLSGSPQYSKGREKLDLSSQLNINSLWAVARVIKD